VLVYSSVVVVIINVYVLFVDVSTEVVISTYVSSEFEALYKYYIVITTKPRGYAKPSHGVMQ